MEKVYIVGAGFMGAGIAQVAAQAGYRAFLNDQDPAILEKAVAGLRKSVDRLHAKGMLSENPETILARLTASNDLTEAAGVDWIIEAVFEDEALKHDLFQRLEAIVAPTAILASNTSSIPITRLAAVCELPGRVVGLHFFGPVPFMGLVEVVKGVQTLDTVYARAADFVRSLGKTPVMVKRDIPMFVMNRVFAAAFNEAVDLVAEGVVSVEDLDLGLRLGYGWNVGPFEIADNAGLDTYQRIMAVMEKMGEPRLLPGPGRQLIEDMVAQGRLGRKVGQGFYRYENGKKKSWS